MMIYGCCPTCGTYPCSCNNGCNRGYPCGYNGGCNGGYGGTIRGATGATGPTGPAGPVAPVPYGTVFILFFLNSSKLSSARNL